MKKILIIGSGIAGLSCAIESARSGNRVLLASPYPSERSQSVMAAGGINAVLDNCEEGDSIASHIEDTIKGGCNIGGSKAVASLCESAPAILGMLEEIGVIFDRDEEGGIAHRAFGAQSHQRTCYAGTSTGKQIVTALAQEARKYEYEGAIERLLNRRFHSALINEGLCHGALLYNVLTNEIEEVHADAVVMATGGQSKLFVKSTGSNLCDGYAIGKLFRQGALLKNLEFVQYHPTTVVTPHKMMLISEAARGEGGRLFYLEEGRRVYFMEDKFGNCGNLMARDIVARCIYEAPSQVYLDVSFLEKGLIEKKLPEILELCRDYLDIDITREPIPVAPAAHYFMGGLAVDRNHRTNIRNLYAIGECASLYHGANRLGGNSLLGALHGGLVAAADISASSCGRKEHDFASYVSAQREDLELHSGAHQQRHAWSVLKDVAESLDINLGISRAEERLQAGIRTIDRYLSPSDDPDNAGKLAAFQGFALESMLTLARAIFTCAEARKETRGSHIRVDYPERNPEFEACTLVSYNDGRYDVRYEREDDLCW